MKKIITLCVYILLSHISISQNWDGLIKKVASDRTSGSGFGYSVAIDGNYAIVGAYQDDTDANGANTLTDAGAAYIFEKNSNGIWIQKQKIVPSSRYSLDQFGWSVDISGTYAVIGSHLAQVVYTGPTLTVPDAGAVWIFERQGSGTWTQKTTLIPDRTGTSCFGWSGCTNPQTSEGFGYSVSISGKNVVVGAPASTYYYTGTDQGSNYLNMGSAFVYNRNTSNTWVITARLGMDWNIYQAGGRYGEAVAIEGNHILIGAPNYDIAPVNTYSNAGTVFGWQYSSNTWNFVQTIYRTTQYAANDNFGKSIDIHYSNAIIGAPNEDEDATDANTITNAGAAYIFKKSTISGAWLQLQKVTAVARTANDNFGSSVSINSKLALVGALNNDSDKKELNSLSNAGAAYTYSTSSLGVWEQLNKLTPCSRNTSDNFGFAVAIDSLDGFIGVPLEDEDSLEINTLSGSGAIYLITSNTKPIASAIINQSVCVSGAINNISFSITDEDANSVTLTGYSSNTTVVPDTGIVFGGSSTNRSISITPNSGQYGTSTIYIVATDNQCVNDTTYFSLTVNPSPSITVQASANTICQGKNFSATASGTTNYSWSTGANTNSIQIQPSTSQTYTVTGTDANGCTADTAISVAVNALPTITSAASSYTTCSGALVILSANGASIFNWLPINQSGQFVNINPTTTTTYTVIGIDANLCTNTSTVNVFVSPCTGIDNNLSTDQFTFYPNPTSGILHINNPFGENADISLFDLTGKRVISLINTDRKTLLDLTNFSDGIYFLSIKSTQHSLFTKIIKQ
ncbi:MAG: T9SS type A sorting domain-containing protein [Bacteroidetes bacterium]|nr:T9SS type A sorting domain-containing protein [Bacteroidota bacterium]